ncbi:hypothetical protein AB996_0304 [Lactococcus cremoris]|uniref:Uncharacterized protein n=1 Tax=Lactococcus lactis subsp. cremoris TaxID=1359 RepID=A0A166KIC5_LACLC|nr:hypothetical protein AB996_0304 [Lactococcus cremoris]
MNMLILLMDDFSQLSIGKQGEVIIASKLRWMIKKLEQ